MWLGRKSSGQFEAAKLIDWHAQHISNPLDRLRYLRAAMVPTDAERRAKRLRYGLPVAVAAVAISSVASVHVWRSSVSANEPAPAQTAHHKQIAVSHVSLPKVQRVSADGFAEVWLVDQNAETEEYSNGLRISNRWAVSNRPRAYPVFAVNRVDAGPAEWRNQPAGIVLHTTESDQAPFEAEHNGKLKHIAEGLLGYVQQKRAYNFVVDRFGRVHRIVRESDAANHSGYSVWADDKWLYLNLNDSFLGISFEAQTRRGDEPAAITPAQVRAGALLIEMLRSRYHLSAGNCVTHAQVSVNPSNMRIGYHTDWAANFPFVEMGLPDNYAKPLPGLFLCGFHYDRAYLASTGGRILSAVDVSERRLSEAAAAWHMPVETYRTLLEKEYRKKLLALRRGAPEGDAS